MKKICLIFWTIIFLLVLVSCVSKNTESSGTPETKRTNGSSATSGVISSITASTKASNVSSATTDLTSGTKSNESNTLSTQTSTTSGKTISTSKPDNTTIPTSNDGTFTAALLIENKFYLKLKSTADGIVTEKILSKNGTNIFVSMQSGSNKVIYLSNDRATFTLDPITKTYVADLTPLSVGYKYGDPISEGSAKFGNVSAYCETFVDSSSGKTVKFYFSDKRKWLGYEEYINGMLLEKLEVQTYTTSIPDDVFFEIPSDYTFYFDQEPIVTWPDDWNK